MKHNINEEQEKQREETTEEQAWEAHTNPFTTFQNGPWDRMFYTQKQHFPSEDSSLPTSWAWHGEDKVVPNRVFWFGQEKGKKQSDLEDVSSSLQ